MRTRDLEVTVGVFECVLHTPTNGPVKARLLQPSLRLRGILLPLWRPSLWSFLGMASVAQPLFMALVLTAGIFGTQG